MLATIDLGGFEAASVDAAADLAVTGSEPVNAVAATFRADLADGIAHELDPWTHAPSSWATSVWMLPEPLTVPDGGALRVRYRRRVAGEADGLLVPYGDPRALAGAIAALLADPEHARRLGDAGRRRVRASHSWRAVAARFRDAYVRTIAVAGRD